MDKTEIDSLDKDSILSDEIIDPLFDEDASDMERDIQQLRDRAKAVGVTKAFDNIVKAKRAKLAEIKRAEKKEQLSQAMTANNMTAFDYNGNGVEFSSGRWIADERGVYTFGLLGPMMACYCPILISMRMINQETGREKVQISYKRDNVWKEMTFDAGVIASNTKIIQLSDYGVPVTSETSRQLVSYLSDFENLNIDMIPIRKSSGKFGWIGDDFIPYSQDIEFDADGRFHDLYESITEHGSLDAWMDLVKGIRKDGRIEPAVCMAASFGSVLLKFFNVSSFIVDIWGESGKGKTVSTMLAVSIWADPVDSKYMTDATSTTTAFEMRQNTLNNLPMMIDDFSKTQQKYDNQFSDIIYMLCGGKGKDRSNRELGLNAATIWRNIILTNIERPLTDEGMRGGAVNRVLDFESQDGYIFHDEYGLDRGNYVVGVIGQNYGFAGKMFVDYVREMDKDELKSIEEDFEKRIRAKASASGSEKEEKQVIPLAILLTADKIATDCIFHDGIYLDLDECVDNLKDVGSVSENERAYDYIIGAVNENVAKFKPEDDGSYRGEVWGKYDDEYVVINKNSFMQIAKSGNFSADAFLKWARKKNLIDCSSDRKRNYKKVRIQGSLAPAWCVKLRLTEPPEEDDFKQGELKFEDVPEDAQDIPFD